MTSRDPFCSSPREELYTVPIHSTLLDARDWKECVPGPTYDPPASLPNAAVMRLFLIPISTRRALIYSRSLNKELSKQLSLVDKITVRAAETWAKWEEADKGWKKWLVTWGNKVQQRIPFEEWGLKSIPSFNATRRVDESHGTKRVDVLFPGNAIKTEKLSSVLRAIATERQDLHRRRMWWSITVAPFTAPIALVPVIPNIPFFYLAYRGWSHWRALNGAKHLEFLVKEGLLNPVPYPALEQLYAKRLSETLDNTHPEKPAPGMAEDVEQSEDRLLLQLLDAKKLATILEAPELALEAERAIAQVEEKLERRNERKEEADHRRNSKKQP